MSECLVCERINSIKVNENPYYVVELETGYVVIADYQTYFGYVLFLCKIHVSELHELEESFRLKFLEEMSHVAHAVFQAFQPDKLNYELLGNRYPHLHWHIIPRREVDQEANTSIWAVPEEARAYKPTAEELEYLKSELKKKLSAR